MSQPDGSPFAPPAAGSGARLDVSIVIPCLNEAPTISGCVERALGAIDDQRLKGEVIVVDNGSTDGSLVLAAQAGARVVVEPRPGYGSAYQAGLAAARGRAILMGDGDGTYDFAELPNFLSLLDGGADLILGSRLKGKVLPGAMPWTHRWVGNPMLTFLLNRIAGTHVSDAHCGLRMVRADVLGRLGFNSPGMEFASEMVMKAAWAGCRITETPITYYPRPTHSSSKLRSVPDGLRHVRYMLAYAPAAVFWAPAVALAAAGAALLVLGNSSYQVVGGDLLLAAGGVVAQAGYWLRRFKDRFEKAGIRGRSSMRRFKRRALVGVLTAITLGALIAALISFDPFHMRVLPDSAGPNPVSGAPADGSETREQLAPDGRRLLPANLR